MSRDEDSTPSQGRATALLSENALAKDWNRPEEDDAWAHFQVDHVAPPHDSSPDPTDLTGKSAPFARSIRHDETDRC